MQPHGPYFGPKAEKLRNKIQSDHNIRLSAWSSNSDIENRSEGRVYLMDAAEDGYISSQELREIYLENLSIVLDHVESLLNTIEGKTVITADHGELLGTPKSHYAKIAGVTHEHPGRVWCPELRIVPWFEIGSETRREITSEEPTSTETPTEGTVQEHLEALGYKT